jgi:NADH:quinone reductase (non-electrogenic)
VESELEAAHAPQEERLQRLLPYIAGKVNTRAALEGELEEGFVWAGQGIGLIHDIPTTQVLIERIVRGAYAITQRMQGNFV